MPSIRSFEDLDCWKECRKLRLFVIQKIVRSLPSDEKWRLADQLTRAARSATANIAEGYGRFYYLDNAKFCRNSRGSCYEVLDHLITACDEHLIAPDLLEEGRSLVTHAVRLINGYIRYLREEE